MDGETFKAIMTAGERAMSSIELKRPDATPWTPPEVAKPPAGPLVVESDWSVVDHVCGACFGRLMGRITDGKRFYRCSNCGRSSDPSVDAVATTAGPRIRRTPSICACHLRLGGRDAGIRCTVNDNPSPANPSEVVARQT